MGILTHAEWLLDLYNDNSNNRENLHQNIVKGNLPHIKTLIQLSSGTSQEDIKTRLVISRLLDKMTEDRNKQNQNFIKEVGELKNLMK